MDLKVSLKAIPDGILIRQALDNDELSYKELMRRYSRSVFHHLLKMVRNRDDAEDLTIETFAKAFKNLYRYNEQYTFGTWVFRIATNNCIDFIRKKKKKLETVSISGFGSENPDLNFEIDIRDDSPTPYELTIQTQKIEIMRNFVKQLPDKYSTLIDLRYFQELSYNEIAIEMDLPLGTVKAQLHRAREILLNLLREKNQSF